MSHLSLETLVAWRDGHATDAERAAAEAHLAICAECSKRKQILGDLDRVLRDDWAPPAAWERKSRKASAVVRIAGV